MYLVLDKPLEIFIIIIVIIIIIIKVRVIWARHETRMSVSLFYIVGIYVDYYINV